MKARSRAWRRAVSLVVSRPSPSGDFQSRIAPLKSLNRSPAALWVSASRASAVQAEVRPEGRSDEAHRADRDRGRVEQGHAALGAVEREQATGFLDVGAVELVVTGDIEDMLRAGPDLGREPDRAVFRRRQVSRKHDNLRPRGERRDFTAIFEMEIGEDLDAHGLSHSSTTRSGTKSIASTLS